MNFGRVSCGPTIQKMSEPSHGATLLRVVPASFYFMIPLWCGPPKVIGGLLMTLEVRESRGAGVLLLLDSG